MNKRVAMITVHECPLASSEGKERGGINVYTFELSKALARLGWSVDAFTRIQDSYNPRIVQVNDRFRVIHIASGPATPLSKDAILASLPEFTQHVNEFIASEGTDYTAIHAHYYLSGMVAQKLDIVSSSQTPIIMTFHTLGLLKQLISRSYESEDPAARVSSERSIMKNAQKIITSSDTGKEYLTGLYECPPEKVLVIPPGVDTTLFTAIDKHVARQKIGASLSEKLVLAVGRLDPVKGFDVLLAAIKILAERDPAIAQNISVMIVGGDVGQSNAMWSREMKKLDALRKAYNLSAQVKFVQAQAQEMLPYFYSAADVLVMPSHYESFGMVALEAMSCATPVIATDVTGISPFIKGLPHSHIISANNPVALSYEIATVLSSSQDKRMRASEINAFDWDVIAARIASVYETEAKRR